MDEIEKNNGEIIIYRTEDGRTQLEVRLEDENVWLSQQQIANLFGVQRPAITKHLRNIFESGELEENSVSSILEHTASDGKNYKTQFYNLDAIISVGYRVNSLQATHFRRWATERLKEYLIKGFAMDDKRLKEMGGGGYWYELLNRIRDIRSSEKVLYRQVLDLYATSVDYDPKADESIRFFKIVQNKLHYAAHGHTAAEVIFERADAEKPFMGLTTFPGEQPRKEDVLIAKNYLNEKELKMATPHINAEMGDFADVVLMPGDPLRAKYIAETFLEDAREVNNVRGMLGFTGTYKGRKISVMGHGMGIPSCSIYTKELITDFGVKKIIRVGSCGAVLPHVKLRDVVIGMGACTDSKVNRIRFKDHDFAAIADFDMVRNAVDAAKALGVDARVGNLFSADLFYSPDGEMFDVMEKYGILGVEMEAAGIYGVAAEFGAKALTICTVSDHIRTHEQTTAAERQTTFNDMIKIALESVLLGDKE